jgi:F-type H+-transporting ATPase subunit delta
MDSGAKILAKRYARAYMDLDGSAYGAGPEAAAKAKLKGLLKVFEAARPHMRILTHPVLNGDVKLEVLARILGAANTGHAAAFAALLVREGRFGLLDDVMAECMRINDVFCGVVRAEIYSTYPLSEGEVNRITALLKAASGKKISLRQVIAERVIGGFEIKIGDTVVDATVRGKLQAMKEGLMKA